MTTITNPGNFTSLSVNPSKDKTSTNIIIKGAFSTVKAGNSKKNLLGGKKASHTVHSSKRDKSSADLMEKLLSEITAKYKSNLCKDKNYLERIEKKTMITEIQMLAKALISCDKAQKKQHEHNEKNIKRVQADLLASEEQVKTSLKRQLKLEKENDHIRYSNANLLDSLCKQEAQS